MERGKQLHVLRNLSNARTESKLLSLLSPTTFAVTTRYISATGHDLTDDLKTFNNAFYNINSGEIFVMKLFPMQRNNSSNTYLAIYKVGIIF